MSTDASHLVQQFGLFLLMGLMTTLIDFLCYNLLTRRPLAWTRISANLLSSTCAMSFSFTVNWLLVFHPHDTGWVERAIKFLLVTCTSSFGLQSLVIHTLSKLWRAPVLAVQNTARKLPWTRNLTGEFVDRNTVKAVAVAVGLLWNFCGYKWFVYAN